LERGRIAIPRFLNKTNRRVLLAFGVLAALAVWHASLRVGAGPASGNGFVRKVRVAPPSGDTFRVATLNISSGRGADGRYDLWRLTRAIEGFDLVALQEVRGGVGFPPNQAEKLGRNLKLDWLYAPAESRWYCRQFGNALLSRLPAHYWQRIPLPRRFDRSFRNAVLVVLEHQGRSIRLLATHITQREPREQEIQLKAVIELFLALEKPAILLGDLNTHPENATIRELLDRDDVENPLSRLIRPPPVDRVDWILVRGLKCIAAGVRDEGVSDHPLYWVEIQWPSSSDTEGTGDTDATPPAPRG
jgi:endonuclease/exonuclease/phosphatase family metal-dependent hydrolase